MDADRFPIVDHRKHARHVFDKVPSLPGELVCREGELVTIPEGVEFEILDADPRRIKRLRIHKKPADAARQEARRRNPSSDTPSAA